MAEKAIGITTVVSIFILVIAYLYSRSGKNEIQQRLPHILNAMLEIERNHNVGKVRIAVGYGACNDLFVKGSDLLFKDSPPTKAHHYGIINSYEELKEAYALFFSAGSAAERYVGDESLFLQLIERAEKAASSYYALGGNAPVMAKRFAVEGASVILAASQEKFLKEDPILKDLVAGGPSTRGREDVHLIIEYDKNETWGSYTSSRANRFIIHKDETNPRFASIEAFAEALKTFQPHLFVVGGLQMMDNYPYKRGEREKYLRAISDQISQQPKHTLVHFEMASFTDRNLLLGLKQLIIPKVDSLGMNEQELPNLYSLLKYDNVSVVSDQNPRIAEVLDQMREIFKILGKEANPASRALTRLHVHTLAFQVIMVDLRSPWKDTRAAVTKAALVAHRHVCHMKKVEVDHSDILMDEGFSLSKNPNTGRVMFDDLKPVSCWVERGHFKVCIAPVLICTKVRQTAGGGDNISAAGLILQLLSN